MSRVIYWELVVTMKDREQKNNFVRFLSDREVDYNYEVSSEFDGKNHEHSVHIKEMSWANNLKEISEFLETLDEEVTY